MAEQAAHHAADQSAGDAATCRLSRQHLYGFNLAIAHAIGIVAVGGLRLARLGIAGLRVALLGITLLRRRLRVAGLGIVGLRVGRLLVALLRIGHGISAAHLRAAAVRARIAVGPVATIPAAIWRGHAAGQGARGKQGKRAGTKGERKERHRENSCGSNASGNARESSAAGAARVSPRLVIGNCL